MIRKTFAAFSALLICTPASASDLVELMITTSRVDRQQPCADTLLKSTPETLEILMAAVAEEESAARQLELITDLPELADKKVFLLKGGNEIKTFIDSLDISAMESSRRGDRAVVALRTVGFLAVAGGLITAFIAAKSAQVDVMFHSASPFDALFGIDPPKPDRSKQHFWAGTGWVTAVGGIISYFVASFIRRPDSSVWAEFKQKMQEPMERYKGAPYRISIEHQGKKMELISYSDADKSTPKLAVVMP